MQSICSEYYHLIAFGCMQLCKVLVTGMLVAWAMRLGTYLVMRIRRDKEDKYVPVGLRVYIYTTIYILLYIYI